MFGILKKIFGTANDRIINNLRKEVAIINSFEANISALSDSELKAKTLEFKQRLSSGESLDQIKHEAFAVTREASKRVLNQRHFDVQLIGGLILHNGMIAEMRTGEGKTLVATLPSYLNALAGKGVHVVTANDYLASRDCEWMGKIHRFLGLSVGYVIGGMSDSERKNSYDCDITYTTNNELGFDYLRDNMKFTLETRVQRREHSYAIVDEVDSILIDTARTPLIISGSVDDNTQMYVTIQNLAVLVKPEHYTKDEKTRSLQITDLGISFIENLLVDSGLIKEGTGLYDVENMSVLHHVMQALKANYMFNVNVDYIVRDDSVLIVDEFNGRIMEGRRFSDGLHQALEAKEAVEIQNETQTLASITFQNYFRLYKKLSGMTGTAMTEAGEFKEIYNLDVVSVPTNNPINRIDRDDEVYGTMSDKYQAIVKLVKNANLKGQPVLVGTASIEKSEELSALFSKNGIKHNILNAKMHEQEAYIIAQAGRYGAVTIATNMAGRGTDIMLGGNPEMIISSLKDKLLDNDYQKELERIHLEIDNEKSKVIESGGLLVIGTERHESRRIDNQLRGRSGRQGDVGETRFYLSLEDDLMRIFASDRISAILRNLGLKDGEAIQHSMVTKAIEKAQQKVESHNFEIRKNLLRFDDVMNDQRKVIYEQRGEIISSDDVSDIFDDMNEDVINQLVYKFIPKDSYYESWDLDSFASELERIYSINFEIKNFINESSNQIEIIKFISDKVKDFFQTKRNIYGDSIINNAQKYVLLVSLDQVWKEHLFSLDNLRQGIGFRAYGQKNPLNEYKQEAFYMFESMMENLKLMFIERMSHLQFNQGSEDTLSLKNIKQRKYELGTEDPAFKKYNPAGIEVSTKLQPTKVYVSPENRDATNPLTWGKVSRNETCPCGSGKKYKYCHGAV